MITIIKKEEHKTINPIIIIMMAVQLPLWSKIDFADADAMVKQQKNREKNESRELFLIASRS